MKTREQEIKQKLVEIFEDFDEFREADMNIFILQVVSIINDEIIYAQSHPDLTEIIREMEKMRIDGNDVCTRSGNLMLDSIIEILRKHQSEINKK
ncbi:MAG: hypothetical protein WC222_11610 [Parachlamydiales bacterium]|jgi:hypothetical protein